MKINRWIALALIALLVVGAVAAIGYTAYAQGGGTDNGEGSEAEDSGAALQGQADITQEQAETIALAQYPGAKVVAAELENEGGRLIYSIELDNSAEVEVDANDGTVLQGEVESGTDSNN